MGRKKERTLQVLAVQPGFRGFRQKEVEDLGHALGREITKEVKNALEEQVSSWLAHFAGYQYLGYGANERKLVSAAERAAAKLYQCLQELGEIADVGVERVTYAQGVENAEFMAVLAGFGRFKPNIEGMLGDEIDVAAVQIQIFRDVLLCGGFEVTVSTNNYVTTFNPSPFVKFIDLLWQIEPRLRVFNTRGSDHWDSFSQWICIQLRKQDPLKACEKLVLMERPKLKSRRKAS